MTATTIGRGYNRLGTADESEATLAAFDWFESITADGLRIRRTRESIDMLDARISPHTARFEAIGRNGGSTDALVGLAMVSARLTELRRELPRMERAHEAKIVRARAVLYGTSGRGGLARVQERRGATYSDDADILCLHYIDGEGWASIARRFEPETSNLTVWCKNRARRACNQIDRIGMDKLIES